MPLYGGGRFGNYHLQRPDELPSDDIVRGPAALNEGRLWQESEDGRHPGDAMRDPLRRVSDQRSLFDSDEDLQAYLARMTSPPEPKNFSYEHTFSPGMQARINAEVQPGYRDARTGTDVPQVITPTIGANLGPLSLNGGLQLQQQTDPDRGNPYTQVKPTFGAGLTAPLFGGDAKVGFKITPDQEKLLEAEWKKKILGGELSIGGNYSQSPQGDPNWGVQLRGRIPF